MSRGGKRSGAGRRPGIPNKVTMEFRETVRVVLEKNSANVGLWLTKVAAEDPARALDLLAKLAEYAAPKLGRIELTGDGGGPVKHEVHIVDPTRRNDSAAA